MTIIKLGFKKFVEQDSLVAGQVKNNKYNCALLFITSSYVISCLDFP